MVVVVGSSGGGGGGGGGDVLPGMVICSPWTTEAAVLAMDGVPAGTDVSAAVIAASEFLFHVSGRQFPGICSDTVRPMEHRPTVEHRLLSSSTATTMASGYWPSCGCGGVSEVTLGGYPIVGVSQVLVDGQVLDPSRYAVDDYTRLVRLADPNGAPRRWPCWQRMDLPPTEKGTWQVSYRYGAMPPVGGQQAAKVLAAEYVLAMIGDGSCRLPRRMQTVARQGVSIVAYPADLLAGGRTGIAEVDMWIASVNPHALMQRATIHDPMRRRSVRRRG